MPLLASDVMDQTAGILNDTALSLYTYTAQLPYLKKSNEELEQHFAVYGVQVERKKSAAIVVLAGALVLALPADFFLPIKLFERASGNVNDPWVPMTESSWEPDGTVPVNTLGYWAFRNNAINFVGSTVDRDVLLEYERTLAVITSSSSPEDYGPSKNFLASRTAELCARYVGQNKVLADDIRDNDVSMNFDSLIRVLVLNTQGSRQRRPRFRTQRLGY